MDAKPATPLNATLLGLICLLVTAAGLTWQSWDMFGAKHRPMLRGWDDAFYYFWLPSVVIDHDLDFTNQLAQCEAFTPDSRYLALVEPRTPTGMLNNKYPPGWAIGSLPFFLVAHAFSPAGSTGFEPQYLVSVFFGQLIYACLGLWLAGKIIAQYFPPAIARVAVLAVWLASPLAYYQTVRLAMSHNQVFALGMVVFWLALRLTKGEIRPYQWALLGFCASLLVVTRNVTVVYLILPAFVVVQKLRDIRAAIWLILGAVGPLLVQLAVWKILYGSWLAYSYGGERFDFSNLHLWGILFSPRHGWFYWHPLILPALVAFIVWACRRGVGWAWLVSLGAMVLLNAAWPTWWLGSSFGNRGFELADFFVMMGLGYLLQTAQNRPWVRAILRCLITAAIAWNLILLVLFLAGKIPRNDAVTYGDACRALTGWFATMR